MATTFGSFALSNGQVVGVVQVASAGVNARLPVDIAKPVDAATNSYDFQVASPCKIVDWDSGAIASGVVEIYANNKATGVQCTLVKCGIAIVSRVFPRAGFVPGRTYSLRVSVALPA